jgi:hypothetical protein
MIYISGKWTPLRELAERSDVSYSTLRRRILDGMSPEEAMTAPLGGFKLFYAFGEGHSKAHWLRDDRCIVTNTTIYRRMSKGMTFEEAITTPDVELIPAFGEWKGVWEWEDDDRCVVSAATLWKRLQAGWPPEDAIQLKKLPYWPRKPHGKLTYAFGEWKSIFDWFNDDRCPLDNISALYQRLGKLKKNGMSAEEAITTPAGLGKLNLKPGMKFYLLTFIETLDEWNEAGNRLSLWQCECGHKHKACAGAVTGGICKSCGCLYQAWVKKFSEKYRNPGGRWISNRAQLKKMIAFSRAAQAGAEWLKKQA